LSLPELHPVAPFWLERPDREVLEIAGEAEALGYQGMWLGEMASFDVFALATAVGLQAPRLQLTVGPLAVAVRSPVALALGVSSLAALTGRAPRLALGASSPEIVTAWHDREWTHSATRMSETLDAIRPILAGERADFHGQLVRTKGFRLRSPQPDTKISVAAFGPAMTHVAATKADEVVLNLVSVEHVAKARATIEAGAARHGRATPRLAVWVTVALDPGTETLRALAAQIAIYLRPPGYGEMFIALGHEALVARARQGAHRSELATSVPRELLEQVCAIGTEHDIRARLAEYHVAGAAHIGIVPATAEDPAGARVLKALSPSTETSERAA
jgi:probable F420-dependent oxidoreductase